MKPPTETTRRQMAVEVRVLDSAKGIVEYVASDESLDSYREIVRADGWRFDHFQKNAPFVDSHDYRCIEKLVGKVVGFMITGKRLVETVQWAIDVPENRLASLGWKMTEAGYLKAVSVGFRPERMATKWDQDPTAFGAALAELKIARELDVRVVYLQQQQLELSSVIIGANPNALAKAYKAGVIDEPGIDFLSGEFALREHTASAASDPGHAADEATAQARQRFLDGINKLTRSL